MGSDLVPYLPAVQPSSSSINHHSTPILGLLVASSGKQVSDTLYHAQLSWFAELKIIILSQAPICWFWSQQSAFIQPYCSLWSFAHYFSYSPPAMWNLDSLHSDVLMLVIDQVWLFPNSHHVNNSRSQTRQIWQGSVRYQKNSVDSSFLDYTRI